MIDRLRRFRLDTPGVSAIEYGLIAALVSVVIIGAAALLGADIASIFGQSEAAVESTAGNFN